MSSEKNYSDPEFGIKISYPYPDPYQEEYESPTEGEKIVENWQLDRIYRYPLTISQWVEKANSIATGKGWHDTPRSPLEYAALIHSEVSELVEAYRTDPTAPSKKVPTITATEEELADVLIRCFDFAGETGLRLEQAVIEKSRYNESRPYRHGNKKY